MINVRREAEEGAILSKMAALRWHQMDHAVRAAIVESPGRFSGETASVALLSQLRKSGEPSGTGIAGQHQERMPCQMMREKTHPTRRW